MRLDRSREFGRIAGEIYIPDGCDRPAAFEQDGKLFDVHDRLIEPGVPASIVPSDDGDDGGAPDIDMTVAEILRQADGMQLRKFKGYASKILGADCPATKAAMIEALEARQKDIDASLARRAKNNTTVHIANSGVDLVAWAMGNKEYLFGDVRKAIRQTYGKNVTERDDAVEFLVERGLVYADHARKDVIREA
jgi:hypothetical protein